MPITTIMDLDNIKDILNHIATTLDHDDDWTPVVLLEKNDYTAVVVLAIQDLENNKDTLAFAVETVIRQSNPDAACFVATGWMGASIEPNRFLTPEDATEAYQKGWIPPPSQDPDRKEIVMIIEVTAKGENRMILGYVRRFRNRHPEIYKWRDDPYKQGELKGRIADAMKRGFTEANENGTIQSLDQLPFLSKEPETKTKHHEKQKPRSDPWDN